MNLQARTKFACLKLVELKQKNPKKIIKTINESEELDEIDIPNEIIHEPLKSKTQSVQIVAEKPMPHVSSKIFVYG